MADQELFDGEVRTTIEDDENISFRRANPATPGSRVISWANFKNLLNTLYVRVANVAQNIDGVKTFLKSPIVPDPTTDLEAVNFRTLLSKTGTTPDSIKFNTSYNPTLTQEGELYWNGKWHTIEYDTGLGPIIKVGQTVYDVFYNDTGATIQPFKALHLKSAISFNGELYPTFELADASDYEKIQGTICISCCSVDDGELGICARGATQISGGDTSSLTPGSQLWVSDDGTGDLVSVKPEFPSASISVGGNYNQESSPDGKLFVNITSTFGDLYHEAWDGSVIESFNFTVTSDGTTITGLLENVNPLLNLTLNFSSGTFRLDTTTAPLTIALTAGTDGNEQTNYVYIPKSTKILTISTSGWPTTEHVRIAQLELASAATTQADGGALGNQNINDHLKKEDDNGHLLHITSWIRKQFSTWDSGTEATFNNTGGNGYIQITGGVANQLHEQVLPSFSMVGGDSVRVWNDNSGNRPKITNLAAITAYSDGSTWNNAWGKIVVWRGVNKSGEYSPVNINLPSDGYNSEANALADSLNYADYTIPNTYKSKAILIAAFTFRISGGVITYNGGYQDLRGSIPVTVAGGGGGGAGGVTTFLALTDTPSSYAGQAGKVPVVNSAGSAMEFELKGWLFNAARTFYTNLVSLATANRTVNLPDKDGTIAFLDDLLGMLKMQLDLASTTAADPGAGQIRFNADNTEMYINDAETNGNIGDKLAALSADSVITLKNPSNPVKWANYKVVSTTDNTGWWTVVVTTLDSGTAFEDDDFVGVSFMSAWGGAKYIESLPTYDSQAEAASLDDYSPFKTSNGFLAYKVPTGLLGVFDATFDNTFN